MIDQRVDQLRSARDYLQHLLTCHDDDILTECPYLDQELVKHTPRGSVDAPTLIAAALAAPMSMTVDHRDETAQVRDETAPHRYACTLCVRNRSSTPGAPADLLFASVPATPLPFGPKTIPVTI